MKFKVKGLTNEKEFEDSFEKEGEALLDVVERHGIKLPYGCRAGSCGVCRVQIKGDLSALPPRGIVEEDIASRCHDPVNIRLACQLRIVSDKPILSFDISIAPEAVIPEE